MLKSIGFNEVFTPKIYPDDPNFRSASVDWEHDQYLTIPADDLAILNATDWYKGGNRRSWELASRYFDVAFVMLYRPDTFEAAQKHFEGQVLWRTFGLSNGNTYSSILSSHPFYEPAYASIRKLYGRFWFAEAYDHLHEVEDRYLRSKAVFLPLGMNSASRPRPEEWTGTDRRTLFVCPDVNFNPVYEEIYRKFRRDFPNLPCVIGGAQSIAVDDDRVLGYLPYDEHLRNMKQLRVMFYHSTEPTHIHFHPFEAIVAGMPLIFMGGGILDRFGGKKLPGRSATIREARKKLDRILAGDEKFIREVRESQHILLEPMKPENCRAAWEVGMAKVLSSANSPQAVKETKAVRIAILTEPSDLQVAEQAADLIVNGAREAGRSIKVVIGIRRAAGAGINRLEPQSRYATRDFGWEATDAQHVNRAMHYGRAFSRPRHDRYVFPNDGMNNFLDCDIWVLANGELKHTPVPLRPLILHADRTSLAADLDNGDLPDKWLSGIASLSNAVVTNEERASSIFVGMEGVSPANLLVMRSPPTLEDSKSYWELIEECL
ncbi:hypothetical protein GTW25_08735 [Aliihoeflea aestuarii]|uniref:hypothetical protein n=1 Tax=Aliihoeflea aestuarii TaxID=453840 RepID=UPI0020934F9A|nr:hypothetical protein [Aliihoeflea aestuarii]MCO6391112.1 hypothetical protein [Aliihoeflea aestuarii]